MFYRKSVWQLHWSSLSRSNVSIFIETRVFNLNTAKMYSLNKIIFTFFTLGVEQYILINWINSISICYILCFPLSQLVINKVGIFFIWNLPTLIMYKLFMVNSVTGNSSLVRYLYWLYNIKVFNAVKLVTHTENSTHMINTHLCIFYLKKLRTNFITPICVIHI